MKPKTMIATAVLAALPFFAVAAVDGQQGVSPRTANQSATSETNSSKTMCGMMNAINQVKTDMSAMANENDVTAIHKTLARDEALIEQAQSHMRNMNGSMMSGRGSMMSGHGSMMSGGTMSGGMNGCGMMQQPKK